MNLGPSSLSKQPYINYVIDSYMNYAFEQKIKVRSYRRCEKRFTLDINLMQSFYFQ